MAAVKAGVLALPTTSHGAHKARADENRAAATSATSEERPRMMPVFCGLRVRYPDTNFMAVVLSPRPAKVEKATTVVWTRANWPKTSLPRHRAATTEPAKDALCPTMQPAAFQPTPRTRRSDAEPGHFRHLQGCLPVLRVICTVVRLDFCELLLFLVQPLREPSQRLALAGDLGGLHGAAGHGIVSGLLAHAVGLSIREFGVQLQQAGRQNAGLFFRIDDVEFPFKPVERGTRSLHLRLEFLELLFHKGRQTSRRLVADVVGVFQIGTGDAVGDIGCEPRVGGAITNEQKIGIGRAGDAAPRALGPEVGEIRGGGGRGGGGGLGRGRGGAGERRGGGGGGSPP